jgi:threonine/homoserine/homoserine lactone efflux protein
MLPGTDLFLLFLVAAVMLIVTPGPDTLFIAGRSLAQGPIAGLVALAGISAGAVIHSVAAALGFATLFVLAPWLYDAVRWAGIAYLLWLAWGSFMGGEENTAGPDRTRHRLSVVFRQALMTNLLNPKVILFFGAFLPQFTEPARGHVGLQFFTLGMVIVAINTVWMVGVIHLAGSAGRWLSARPSLRRVQRYILGATLAGIALWLAWPDRAR